MMSRNYSVKLNCLKKYKYNKLEILNSKDLSKTLDTNFYSAGCLDLGAGHLNPLKFAIGLSIAAVKKELKFLKNLA